MPIKINNQNVGLVFGYNQEDLYFRIVDMMIYLENGEKKFVNCNLLCPINQEKLYNENKFYIDFCSKNPQEVEDFYKFLKTDMKDEFLLKKYKEVLSFFDKKEESLAKAEEIIGENKYYDQYELLAIIKTYVHDAKVSQIYEKALEFLFDYYSMDNNIEWLNIRKFRGFDLKQENEKEYKIAIPASYRRCVEENNAGIPSLQNFKINNKQLIFDRLISVNKSDSPNIMGAMSWIEQFNNLITIPFALDVDSNMLCFEFLENKYSIILVEFSTNKRYTLSKDFNSFLNMLY